jgi:hypothetical protein
MRKAEERTEREREREKGLMRKISMRRKGNGTFLCFPLGEDSLVAEYIYNRFVYKSSEYAPDR